MRDRNAEHFDRVRASLEKWIHTETKKAVLGQGDCLELLRYIPNESVSLILTDPPYHVTQKDNIYGDKKFREDEDYIAWMKEVAVEWHRILNRNGSLYCFCDSSMSGRLEVMLAERFNILARIVWTKPNDPGFDGWKGKMRKEALRQWYPHSERILFAEPAIDGNLHRSPFAAFLRETRLKSGLSQHELTEITGAYGKVNHGGAVSNWETGRNTPSREQYSRIRDAILGTGKVDSMPAYEEVVRPFNMDGSRAFTDVWDFPSVRPYKGKHPAEKPLEMLEHIVEASSFPGDIVVDCFAGSGSTAIAALSLGRRSVSIEIESKWVRAIRTRLLSVEASEGSLPPEDRPTHRGRMRPAIAQLPLFEAASSR